MLIRRFEENDRDGVRRIHVEAFGRPDEARLVEALLDAGDAVAGLSLVAEVDEGLVGHVMCSRATVGANAVVALGPIGVLPERQGLGVGSRLVRAALTEADALGAPLVALLGSTAYYSRFGFVPAESLGIHAPDATWGASFQARTLTTYDPALVGPFRYAPAFGLS